MVSPSSTDCRIRSQIRIRATVGLNVGESALEQLFRTITRQILNDIDLLAATVIALAWIAFGILVGEHAAHRFHDRWRSEVLRSDQLDARTLTLELLIDRGCNLRVLCGKVSVVPCLSPFVGEALLLHDGALAAPGLLS